ncbi:MAG: hypothetical protein U1A07_20175 [Phenylobacterium sp.]|nr:hypothetical protein [Phenylobacterium sp.]
MTTLKSFLDRCERYRERRDIAESYLSRLLFNDGKVVGALRKRLGLAR